MTGFSANSFSFSRSPLYFHRVKEGQSLNDIAAGYNVPIESLAALNPEVTEASDSHAAPIISASIVVIDLRNSSC